MIGKLEFTLDKNETVTDDKVRFQINLKLLKNVPDARFSLLDIPWFSYQHFSPPTTQLKLLLWPCFGASPAMQPGHVPPLAGA